MDVSGNIICPTCGDERAWALAQLEILGNSDPVMVSISYVFLVPEDRRHADDGEYFIDHLA